MTKNEFLKCIESRLSGLPENDIKETIEYYSEMIDERIEDGLTEEEAAAAVGSVDEAVAAALGDVSIPKLIKTRIKKERVLKAWEIVLIIIGSPIWLSLLIAALAVVLSLYIVMWSVVISFYAAVLALGAAALGSLAAAVMSFAGGQLSNGLVPLAAALCCAGLAILLFFFSNKLAGWAVFLGKKIILGIKRCFVGKEVTK